MTNVDEGTASRLIFAPMDIFLAKCCGNATPKISRQLSPMPNNVTARTLTISTPSLRLGGNASGQTPTEIGRIEPCGSRPVNAQHHPEGLVGPKC
jgi:hypothetical protein